MGKLPTAPPALRGDEAEVLHGDRIADPYRWLERDSAETRAWTAAQNARTRAALDAIEVRSYFHGRLRALAIAASLTVGAYAAASVALRWRIPR